jgi:galactan 5-O-arabinofuranosyltransferase
VRTIIANSFNRGAYLNRRGVRSFLARGAAPLAEAAVMLAGAAAGAGIVHAFISASHFTAQSEVARGFGPPWAAVMILLAVLGYVAQNRIANPLVARGVVALLAGIAAGFVTAPLTAGLHGTDQPLNTIARGDMQFRTEYVTRFAATWHLRDYTFHGLDAFYPPGWFWVAGRTAHVLGLHEAWHIIKPFSIFTVGAALAVAYLLWRNVLSPAGALAAAIGASLVLSSQVGPLKFSTTAWYSAYSCFVAVTGAAWLAAMLHNLRLSGRPIRLVLLTLVGAGLALCYYLLFIILAVALIVLAALPPGRRRLALLRAAGVLGGVVLLTAVFWVPLLKALAHGAASQGQFVRPDFLRVSVGIAGGPVALTVLAVIALIALALTFWSSGSQAVAALIGATILYQVISVVTLVWAHNQLQPHRAVTMMWATYGAAVPVAIEAFRRHGPGRRLLEPPVARVLAIAAAVAAIPAAFVIGAEQGSDLAGGPFARQAHERPALAQSRLIADFINHSAGKPAGQLTILSGDHTLLITRPYYGFLPLRARYAHPEAHLHERISVLRAATRCPDPACVARTLERSRFGRLDALVLARTPLGFRVNTEEDRFPEPQPVQIYFKRGSFAIPFWIKRSFPGYRVFVRRPGAAVPA